MRKGSMLVFLLAAALCAPIWAQTDVAVGGYGAFNQSNSTDGITQSPSNQAGALIEVRHIVHPWLGYEGAYSWNRANQAYSTSAPGVFCGVCTASYFQTPVPSNAHELSGAWVASLKFANIRPFALAGVGVLFNVPASSEATETTVTICGGGNPACTPGTATSTVPTSTSTKAVFVYGGGLDWTLLPHLGLRFQYRGNLYKAPDLINVFTSSSSFTHTAEPVVGAFFRF